MLGVRIAAGLLGLALFMVGAMPMLAVSIAAPAEAAKATPICQKIVRCAGCKPVYRCRVCRKRPICIHGVCHYRTICPWGPVLNAPPKGARVVRVR